MLTFLVFYFIHLERNYTIAQAGRVLKSGYSGAKKKGQLHAPEEEEEDGAMIATELVTVPELLFINFSVRLTRI